MNRPIVQYKCKYSPRLLLDQKGLAKKNVVAPNVISFVLSVGKKRTYNEASFKQNAKVLHFTSSVSDWNLYGLWNQGF
jgi:hypothetical protein